MIFFLINVSLILKAIMCNTGISESIGQICEANKTTKY